MQRTTHLWLAIAVTLAGCSDPGGRTSPDGATIEPDADIGADSGVADLDASPVDDTSLPDLDASPVDAGPPGLQEVERPDPPPLGEQVEIVSVTLRTGTGTTAGTDDGIRICLTADDCFNLDTPDVNDREPGETEVFHLDTDLPRAAVDRVTIETTSTADNNDRWTPACVDVRLDGDPVYCNDDIGVFIGTGDSNGEVPSWTDPDGLVETCDSCWGSRLTHGPLIGPPDSQSVRVGARADATRAVALRLGTRPDLSDGVTVAWSYPRPQDDFTTDLVAEGLRPDTEYFYRVEVDDEADEPIRAIRTAPVPGTPTPTTIAFGSCTRQQEQPIFDVISQTQPDLFFFVGDNNYANTHYLDALRWHYRRFRGLPERARLVAETPIWATWDDHDFLANNSNGTCLGRDQALAAFQEAWANPSHGLPEAPGTFFRSSWGAIDIFMLDCRMYRPDVGDGLNRCEPDPDPPALNVDDGPLGPAQEAWLVDQLRGSEATFKLLACGSRFTPDGSNDSWASFPAARDRLFAAIDEHDVDGVVLLSGDIHRSLFSSIPAPAYPIPELVSSPLATNPGTCSTNDPTQRVCYDDGNAFVELQIDPVADDPTLTARILDASGQEQYSWTINHSELTSN